MILNLDKYNDRTAAIDSDGGRVSYADICALSKQIKAEIGTRQLLFVLTDNNVGGVAWVIASIASGNVPLILNAKTDADLLDNLVNTYHPAYIVSETSTKYATSTAIEVHNYQLSATGLESPTLNSHLSHLLPTSGSTGSPKLVRHRYENIEAAALNISTFFRLKESDRPLLVLPLYYTMGLSVVFSHLYVGATILITNRSMTDAAFWEFMKAERATSFTGVPFSFDVLNLMRIFRMDLPDLHLLTQGGGKMQRKLNLKFAEWCRDTGREWVATYGQSEGTARMAYLPADHAIDKCGSIGIPVPNGRMWLVDDNGSEITAPDTEGELCYEGRNVTMGYATTAADLSLDDLRRGSMATGDLAYRDADGYYFITGRKGRFLKLYGLRIGLDECEQIVRNRFSTECACVGTDERMIVYITTADIAADVKEELIAKTHLVASAIEVRTIEALPKNQAGKILYSQLGNK